MRRARWLMALFVAGCASLPGALLGLWAGQRWSGWMPFETKVPPSVAAALSLGGLGALLAILALRPWVADKGDGAEHGSP